MNLHGAAMELVRGQLYEFRPNAPMFCLFCVNAISAPEKAILLVYLGVLDGVQHLFIYEVPIECPFCHRFTRYHIENGAAPIEVTKEFGEILDK